MSYITYNKLILDFKEIYDQDKIIDNNIFVLLFLIRFKNKYQFKYIDIYSLRKFIRIYSYKWNRYIFDITETLYELIHPDQVDEILNVDETQNYPYMMAIYDGLKKFPRIVQPLCKLVELDTLPKCRAFDIKTGEEIF